MLSMCTSWRKQNISSFEVNMHQLLLHAKCNRNHCTSKVPRTYAPKKKHFVLQQNAAKLFIWYTLKFAKKQYCNKMCKDRNNESMFEDNYTPNVSKSLRVSSCLRWLHIFFLLARSCRCHLIYNLIDYLILSYCNTDICTNIWNNKKLC